MIDTILGSAYQKAQEIKNRVSLNPPQIILSKGRYVASIRDATQRLSLTFFSSAGVLQNAQLFDASTGRLICSLTFDQTGQLLLYHNSRLGEGARFHPSGFLESGYYRAEDGGEHAVAFSPEGALVDWH